jgi:hypothetical protein
MQAIAAGAIWTSLPDSTKKKNSFGGILYSNCEKYKTRWLNTDTQHLLPSPQRKPKVIGVELHFEVNDHGRTLEIINRETGTLQDLG